jgi:ubiquinone/menaquinone biosynthesis C-methylase UbiE
MSAFQKTYDVEQARRYQELKKPGKHRAEMRLVRRAFAAIPRGQSVLDVPCGYGRVMQELHAQGFEVSGADLSEPMLALARANLARCGWSGTLAREDLQALRFPDRAFDALICFRVFHHFPDEHTRRTVVGELCRVARSHVLLSYLSPDSWTARFERLRGRKSARHYTSLAELAGYFEPCGFRLVRDHARLPLVHALHLSVWEREG